MYFEDLSFGSQL